MPQRGDKAALLGTVAENAEQALRLHKTRRSSDLTTRSAALRELQEHLDLSEPLLRVECFDVSHTGGTNVVASMVVLEDGLPKKKDYRRFSVRGAAARDDTSAMRDVIARRFSRYLKELEKAESPVSEEAVAESGEIDAEAKESTAVDREAVRFAYPPSLVVVDGGQPQVNAARAALDELGLMDMPVVGLAKRLEEIWLPGDDFPSSFRAAQRVSTCFSAFGTKLTGSPSPTTARLGPSR